MRRLVLFAVLSVSFTPRAAAQSEDRWLIVPTATPSDSSIEPTASTVRAELMERGINVWSPDDAAKQFEANGSSPAPELTDTVIKEWLSRSEAVLESLVRGAPSRALDQLNEAALLSLNTVAALNREPGLSQKVLDTCLLGVRALLETGSESRAEAQARECRRLVLHGEPSPHMHPPLALNVLDRVDAARTEQTRGLRVESEPSGCAVRVNGLMSGETPFEVRSLSPGRYGVQVECDSDRRGRVHFADVKTGLTEVFVDARFDRTVESQPLLLLRYASALAAEEHRNADAAEIARTVPSTAILLISAPNPIALELGLMNGTPLERRALARVRNGRGGPTHEAIALAVRSLLDEKCMDLTTLPPTVLPCGDEPSEAVAKAPPDDGWPDTRKPRGQFIAGLTLVAAGSASLLTGYVLLGPRARVSEDWVHVLDAGSQGSASLQQKWFNMGVGIVATSSIGAAALVTAMPLALPKRAKTPWWAWLSGGIGVGFAAFSVAYGVTSEDEPGISCSSLIGAPADARACVKRSEQVSVAVLTGLTAAPLLTIPLVYLFRPNDANITPNIEVSRSGGYISLRGEF